jgi:hypothetical protein
MEQVEMPKYKCHKEVWALKIKRVDINNKGNALLLIEDAHYSPIEVSLEYMERHKPKTGGYYVVYKDGYKAFSPAEAFEEGYTKIEDL